MYFDPLTAWVVSFIANGIVVSDNLVGSNKMRQHYSEMEKLNNDMMNGAILSIRDKGYISAERALEKVKFHVEYSRKQWDVRNGNVKVQISRESYEFIIKLCEECAEENWKEYAEYSKMYQERLKKNAPQEHLYQILDKIEMHEWKAKSYESVLEQARKNRERLIQEEEEIAKRAAESDSDGVVIMKCILAIGMCAGAVALMMAGAGVFGAFALIGAGIGGYYLLK